MSVQELVTYKFRSRIKFNVFSVTVTCLEAGDILHILHMYVMSWRNIA